MSGKLSVMMFSTHGYFQAKPVLSNVDTGGQVVYVLEVAKELAKLNCKIDIYTRRFEDKPEIEEVCDDVRVINIACGPKEFLPKEHLIDHLPEYIRNLETYLKEKNLKYDVINSHYWDGGYVGMEMAKILGIPHFHTAHSIGTWKKKGMEDEASSEKLDGIYNFTQRIDTEKEVYLTSDKVIATTPAQKSVFINDYGCKEENILIIPAGFDPKNFFPLPKKEIEQQRIEFNLPNRYILSVGRLATNKGYDLLIKAMKLVLDEVKDVKLLLRIGFDKIREEDKKILDNLMNLVSSLGIQDSMKRIYYVPDKDLAIYYRCADIFALSSRYEPFGMAAIESMACGTAVVATTNGGLKDSLELGVDGLCADPRNTRDYADKLLMILKDRNLRDKMSINASKKAYDNFSWPGIAKITLDAFRNI